MKTLTFVIGSLYAGLAGGLYAHINGFLHPQNFNFIRSFDPMIIIVFGGLGSITGIYTVLTEADDINDPIADAVRSVADGHIVLSRDLANQNHYPAIDILGSISRVMPDVVDQDQLAARNQLIATLAVYKKAEDLINLGAYVTGSNPQIDQAIKKMPEINAFLRQGIEERVDFASTLAQLKSLASR
jgi:flagellum-specific ATP synthase